MKTYWLLGKDTNGDGEAVPKCPFGSILLEELSKVKGSDDFENRLNKKNSANDCETPAFPDMRSLYSPVSFEDVKRSRSAGTSPRESPAKLCVNNEVVWDRDNKQNIETEYGAREFRFHSVCATDVVAIKNQIRRESVKHNNTQENKHLYLDPHSYHNNTYANHQMESNYTSNANNVHEKNAKYPYEDQGKTQVCSIL